MKESVAQLISIDIFTGVEQYCATGCPAPTFSSGYLVREGTKVLSLNTKGKYDSL